MNEAIRFAKWIADFETKEENGFSDRLTLIDNNWYWNGDNDGDQPLSEEKLYEMFLNDNKSKLFHECSFCNNRCNCSTQLCSCCIEEKIISQL